ncbi:hypothetical protein VHEMI01186 [[Torrubiella] hemipterigena]|uniref:Uncharacterized protein n=1 Tax=[Torrubiella] hemipterigena TaxID=1531966 RepID=A0A0A1T6R3_9HYPO|nr:hypothetical protein VHEMI01186 [[Torrubiella] hemipterigena]
MAFEARGDLNEEEWEIYDEDAHPYGPDWQKPMEDPITVPWKITISSNDFNLIEAGFHPRDLGDRWYVKSMPRDKGSHTLVVHFARFWSPAPLYTIAIKEDGENATIESITWEQFEGEDVLTEDWAKREVVHVAREMLECDLPGLEELSRDEWWPKYVEYRNSLTSSIP